MIAGTAYLLKSKQLLGEIAMKYYCVALLQLCSVFFAASAVAEVENPVKDLIVVANDYKAKAKQAKQELVADITSGVDVDVATKRYEEKKLAIFKEFNEKRTEEYKPTRVVNKEPSFGAERGTVAQWEARKSTYASATYEAPEFLLFDKIDLNPKTEIGDTNKGHSVTEDQKRVTVTINARSRYHGEGKSHIIVEPVVSWKYDIAAKVKSEEEQLKVLLFQ